MCKLRGNADKTAKKQDIAAITSEIVKKSMHFVFIMRKAGVKTGKHFSRNIKDNSYARTGGWVCGLSQKRTRRYRVGGLVKNGWFRPFLEEPLLRFIDLKMSQWARIDYHKVSAARK